MSEIADAFRRIEHPNVRTTTSVQPFNCALRSFAQACLQRMKQQLYWVKVRRVLRQVAEACTDSLDRLFHTANLVEGDIVEHECAGGCFRESQCIKRRNIGDMHIRPTVQSASDVTRDPGCLGL